MAERMSKGKSLIMFPNDYTVIDLETTGLSPEYNEIIELSAVRVRNNVVVEEFQSLVRPNDPIDGYITNLTGITNEMVADAPSIENILPAYLEFIGDDIVIGHNINFDVNFLYDWAERVLGVPFTNCFVDTMRISRKALPELRHHRLKDVASEFGMVPVGAHRALCDCKTTYDCFSALRKRISESCGIDEFESNFKPSHRATLNMKDIVADTESFDETHPLFGKRCVFTGTLEKMIRADAAQIVVNIGGICDNDITKKTNFLILGNNDYCKSIKDGKSSKQKKAEEYKLKGFDIEIIPEGVFYDMIADSKVKG